MVVDEVVEDCGGATVVLVAECVLLTTVAGATEVLFVSVEDVEAPEFPTEVVELFTAVPVPSELTEVLLAISSAKAGSNDTSIVAAKVTPSVFEFNIIYSLSTEGPSVNLVSGEGRDGVGRVPTVNNEDPLTCFKSMKVPPTAQ